MALFDLEDWKEWFRKLKWQTISFKFLSFFSVLILLVLFWLSLEEVFKRTVSIAKDLKEGGYVTQEGVTEIVTKSQSVLYDSALSHLMVAGAAVLAAIIAIKGVSYFVNGNQINNVVKKMENGNIKDNLSRFLPKK